MATAAILLAPIEPIPAETDREWFSRYQSWHHLVFMAWYEMNEQLPEEEQVERWTIYGTTGLSSNAASAEHTDNRGIRAAAEAWMNETYAAWLARGKTDPRPTNSVADFEQSMGEPTRLGLSTLINYREAFKKIPKKSMPAGATHAFIANRSDPYEFEFTEWTDFELTNLLELVRVYGGESLLLWTFGQTVHVLHARSAEPGVVPTVTISDHRIDAPAGRGGSLAPLREAMEGGAYAPDWNRLEAQLRNDRISVPEWFAAFGLENAKDVERADRDELWALFEGVAAELLAGRPADAKDVKTLNKIIKTVDEDVALKAKPNVKHNGRRARAIADAAVSLVEAIGAPTEGRWAERFRAAASFWDIGDGPAGDLLVTHRSALGRAAGLGRLLGHYPPALARDALFLPLAAHEAESANGHGFVEALGILAETAQAAGFTLSIHPAAADESFKKALQVAGGGDGTDLAAHGFVDLPKVPGADVLAALEKWYAGARVSGTVVRAEADGTWQVITYDGGKPGADGQPVDARIMESAARELNLRRVFAALGLPDLLEPGEWEEGSYTGSRSSPDEAAVRDEVQAMMTDAEPMTFASPRDLVTLCGAIRHSDRMEQTLLRVEPSASHPDLLQSFRDDLGSEHVTNGGSAWVDGATVCAHAFYGFDTGLLATVLADLPQPVRLLVNRGKGIETFAIDGTGAES